VSRSPVARAALVAALAAVWAIAAYFLWQSKIPSSLHLPHIVVRDYFSASELRDAARFGQFSSRMWILSTVVEVVVFVLYARWGVRFMRESAAGPVGTGMLLGMIGFALLWLAELPFDVASLWWERRHGLSHESYFDHITANWFALGGQFVFLCVALGVAMGLARWLGDWWWLPAALFFVGLATLFAFVSPYLLSTHPLHDAALASQVRSLEQAEGVRHVPVVVQQVHTVTALPNAEAMGLGPSRRIVLWDTLIDGRFSERELRVVLAHEIGHLARHHIWKDVAWYALFAFPGVYLLMRITRRRGGMGEPEAVPLALLGLVVLGLLALPLQNAISRHLEAEADWMALRTTHDPAAATQLFRRFVSTTLDEPSPSTWDYVMLENHPTIAQRIAMAQAWRRWSASHH
jgi:STE24 endopeptidase